MKTIGKCSHVATKSGSIEIDCKELNALRSIEAAAFQLNLAAGFLVLKLSHEFTVMQLNGKNPDKEMADAVLACMNAIVEHNNAGIR